MLNPQSKRSFIKSFISAKSPHCPLDGELGILPHGKMINSDGEIRVDDAIFILEAIFDSASVVLWIISDCFPANATGLTVVATTPDAVVARNFLREYFIFL